MGSVVQLNTEDHILPPDPNEDTVLNAEDNNLEYISYCKAMENTVSGCQSCSFRVGNTSCATYDGNNTVYDGG